MIHRRSFLTLPLAACLHGAEDPPWAVSKPDLKVYIPEKPGGADNTNQHFQVVALPDGAFLAIWTQGAGENAPNHRIVSSRSTDQGRTWTTPIEVDGPQPGQPRMVGVASWAFPIVAPRLKRVYCVYNKNIGIQDVRPADTGALRIKWSEDGGQTWSREFHDYPVGRTDFSHPDPKIPETWIVYQNPLYAPDGRVLAGFTRWASKAADPDPRNWGRNTEVAFLSFDNILREKDPAKLQVTTYPKGPGIRLYAEPEPKKSIIQEPTLHALKDGRMLCVMRTYTGKVYFALSPDGARTWGTPRPLCYEPEGAPILNPIAPCPLYRLGDGRYLLVFFNNDGGPSGPGAWLKNRTPAWYTVGREIPNHPIQPIRFGQPRILVDNHAEPLGTEKRTEIATYTSYFESKGKRYLWYPDRKHYLLGKYITDGMLDACDPGKKS
ncbi:sialidase family protein [Paludibaculum fermentans]|uniref:sialidase family protein n=1 Tax=Paludibaculum fermentans TaxID=1473598 RepID=UPI003EB9D5C1